MLGCFLEEPDVRFVAICDVKAERREAVKKMADDKYGNQDCAMYRDLRELLARSDIDAVLIATGPELARHGLDPGGQCRQGRVLREALHEEHRPEPGAGRDVPPDRPRVPGRHAAAQPAQFRVRDRSGPARQARQAPDAPRPSGRAGHRHQRLAARRSRNRTRSKWTGTCTSARRPGGRSTRQLLDGFNFEKGGGLAGGGCLEWGSHCVDLCQWANDADHTAPVEYEPQGKELHARYANGVKLVMRNDGWLPLGSCPVRFEGDTGWVETGDDGEMVASSPALARWQGAPKSPATRPTSTCATSWTA